jgi:hypothetical protein
MRHFIFKTPKALSMTFLREEWAQLNISFLPRGSAAF